MAFRTRDHRKSIPASVKVECLMVALAEALGLASDTRFEFDHTPALCLREFDPETGRFTPDQNDPAFIIVRTPEDHHVKTFGTKATTAGSDVHLNAKNKRLSRGEADHQQMMASKIGLCDPPERKPSRIKNRGFEKPARKYEWPKRPFSRNARSKRP